MTFLGQLLRTRNALNLFRRSRQNAIFRCIVVMKTENSNSRKFHQQILNLPTSFMIFSPILSLLPPPKVQPTLDPKLDLLRNLYSQRNKNTHLKGCLTERIIFHGNKVNPWLKMSSTSENKRDWVENGMTISLPPEIRVYRKYEIPIGMKEAIRDAQVYLKF